MAENSKLSTVVLITGCTKGGIGFSLCEAFAERGCVVYATARRLEAMEGFSRPTIRTLTLDVNDGEGVKKTVETVIEREGKIDILISNAGALCVGPVLDVAVEDAQKSFNTNYFATVRLAQAVIPHMAARKKGLVINVGSVSGEVPTPFVGHYAAAKAALHAVTEVLNMECRHLGVHVMLLLPGSVRSNIAKTGEASYSMPDNSLYKAFLEKILTRARTSQDRKSMPTDEFATEVVNRALGAHPPTYLWLGGRTWQLWAMRSFLPRAAVLWLMWKIFVDSWGTLFRS